MTAVRLLLFCSLVTSRHCSSEQDLLSSDALVRLLCRLSSNDGNSRTSLSVTCLSFDFDGFDCGDCGVLLGLGLSDSMSVDELISVDWKNALYQLCDSI